MERRGIYVRIPQSQAWLEGEMRAVAVKEGRGISELVREAFCEWWGPKHPSLKRKHEIAMKAKLLSEPEE